MELVSELGKRTVMSSTGKSDTRMWGLFKCPSCGAEVERTLQKGRTSKSCGRSGCRVFSSNNSWNANMKEDDKLKNLPYYSSFNDYYRRLNNNTTVTLVWKTFREFTIDMHSSYIIAKNKFSKVTLYITNASNLDSSNCYWVEDMYVRETDFSTDVSNNIKHSLMLEQETNVKHSIIARTLSKMDDSFGLTTYQPISKFGFFSRPTMAYILTDYQYTRLRDRILDSVKRTVSTHVYLIKCGTSIKIGTTHDIDKRFKALTGANAYPIELIYSKDVTNGIIVESHLHTKYAEFNQHHEWFNLTEDQVKETIAYLDSVK